MSSATEPYASGKIKTNLYAKKRDVTGSLVVLLDGRLEDRGLSLIAPLSRCLCRGQVHELIMTDETSANPGNQVYRISYIGFFAVEREGVIVVGDEMLLDGQKVGILAGFDETHMPNHLNIVIQASSRKTGIELSSELEAVVTFRQPGCQDQ